MAVERLVNGPARTRRRIAAVAAWVVVAVVSLGVADAYWTRGGNGSGSAANASADGLVLAASFASGIYPGGTETVHFTVDNPNSFAVPVSTISLTSVTVDQQHQGCDVADFSMLTVTVGETVPALSTAHALGATGTLAFANTALNQDACQGATITLHVTSA